MKWVTASQIGKCGELLVQYHLLREGIDSAPMTTDTGIDLLAFSEGRTVSIQVKTSTHHDDETSSWVLWEIPQSCPANYVAIADLEANKGWMVRTSEFLTKGTNAGATRRLLWSTDPRWKSRTSESDFKEVELDKVSPDLFGGSKDTN